METEPRRRLYTVYAISNPFKRVPVSFRTSSYIRYLEVLCLVIEGWLSGAYESVLVRLQ